MMSVNPYSAGQPSQASHFNHYGAPSGYTYSSTIQGRQSTDQFHPEGEAADARLMEAARRSSYLPPHLPPHLSPHPSPHQSPSSVSTNQHSPYPSTFADGYPSKIDQRSKSMTSEAPLSAVQAARKASSPALSRRRKRSNSDDANSEEKDDAGVAGNVTMFQCRGFGDCQMVFTRSEHLARHVRKHTGERPFQCHCGKAFSRLDNLRQHAQTVHSDEQDRNETMMQELTSLHSSLAASAAQAQVAHAQVLGKTGLGPPSGAFVSPPSGPAVASARRKSSMTSKGAAPLNKKRSSLASTSRRDSIISQSSAAPRSTDEAYFADQKEVSPQSSYYHSYPDGNVAAAIAPSGAVANGQSTFMSNGSEHGFQYARPPSSSGAYSTFGHSTFGHNSITAALPQETPYYAHYDHSAIYAAAPPSSLAHSIQAAPFAQMETSGPGEYNAYPATLSHSYNLSESSGWRDHEVGPRGEEYYHAEGSAAKSNFQSTLSAHLAMRAPVLRPGRGVSPPPSTSHSMRPSSSSSIGQLDRPILPPLSSLSRPGTSHSNAATPIAFNTGRRPSLLEPSQIPLLIRENSDDKRPYTSPAEPHLLSANGPMLPSVRPTSAIRPGSRGSILDPPSLFESSKNRMPFDYRRAFSSAGRDMISDQLRTSPPTSHSPFRFQPPPLPSQGFNNLTPLSSNRPGSRDRPLTGNLPSLSTTLDSLKRSRELRGKEEEYAFKRLRPFTSGDLPAPSRFGSKESAEVLGMGENGSQQEPSDGIRRVSIASLVENHDEQGDLPTYANVASSDTSSSSTLSKKGEVMEPSDV